MFADGIVLAALHYVNRGIKADQKTRETEAAKEVKQQHEMDKAESRAQHGATRENEKSNKHKGNEKKHFNVQQPKRD
jgi:phage-related tail fiber protein